MFQFPRKLLWLLLYAAGTLGWMVFLEHGPGWGRFQSGLRVELTRAWNGLRKLTGSGGVPVPGPVPLVVPSGPGGNPLNPAK